jgi:hypothetical protein
MKMAPACLVLCHVIFQSVSVDTYAVLVRLNETKEQEKKKDVITFILVQI